MKILRSVLILSFIILSPCFAIYAQENNEIQNDSLTFGDVTFQLNVDSAYAIINNKFREPVIVKSGDTLNIKTGETSIKLSVIHDELYEEIITIAEDSIYSIKHDFQFLELNKKTLNNNIAARHYFDANLLVITDSDSDIFLDDELIGKEYVFTNAPIGRRLLRIESSDSFQAVYTKNSSVQNVSNYSFRIVEIYINPTKARARRLAFIPGFSQAYKYQATKSMIMMIGNITAFTTLSALEIKYRLEKNDYDDLLKRYNNSVSVFETTALGDLLVKQEKRLDNFALYRNISLIGLIGVYTYNVLDGFLSKPKMGYRKSKPYSFYLGTDGLSNVNLNLKLNLGN